MQNTDLGVGRGEEKVGEGGHSGGAEELGAGSVYVCLWMRTDVLGEAGVGSYGL